MRNRFHFGMWCILSVGSHAADMKCPAMPEEMTRVTRDVSVDVKANAGILGKIAAPEIGAKTAVTAKAIFEKYPNVDRLVVLQMLSATYCSALNTAGITGAERLDRWERFMDRYLELKVSAESAQRSRSAASRPGAERFVPRTIPASSGALRTTTGTPLSNDEKYRSALSLAAGNEADKAMPIFRELAAAGYSRAQYQLGRAALLGESMPQSYSVAFDWFKRSAKGGYPAAQHNLAVLYQDGLGTSRDQNQAYIWFGEAARGGFFASQDLLTKSGRSW